MEAHSGGEKTEPLRINDDIIITSLTCPYTDLVIIHNLTGVEEVGVALPEPRLLLL